MRPQSLGWPGLILSEWFRMRGWIAQETEGLKERLWILRHWASWRKSRAKGRGTGRANRLSSQGLREPRPGIRPSLFLPSFSHFFSLSPRILFSRPYPRPIRPYDLDSRQCGIILCYTQF